MNIIFSILTAYYTLAAFFRRKVFVKHIKPTDLVLDVGSGDKPLWRSDVIVDKFLHDDQQRHSGKMVFDNKKLFIEADVENLPFKDKAFDFVFCAHLLEHVENPDKAIRELTRVAKRGYIEVPNGIVDMLAPFPPHLWFCNHENGVLQFYRKEKEKSEFLRMSENFGNHFYRNSLLQYLLAKDLNKIFISLYWKDSVKHKVVRARNPYIYTYKPDRKHEKGIGAKVTFAIYLFTYLFMTRFFYQKKYIDEKQIFKKKSK